MFGEKCICIDLGLSAEWESTGSIEQVAAVKAPLRNGELSPQDGIVMIELSDSGLPCSTGESGNLGPQR